MTEQQSPYNEQYFGKVNSLMETDLTDEARRSEGARALLDQVLTEFVLPERFQLDMVYRQLRKVDIHNMGVTSYAELTIKLCRFCQKAKKGVVNGRHN